MSDASGSLCVDWVWGQGDDDFEPIGALDYWQTHAVIEALKPYAQDCRAKATYYKAKGEVNRGTEVLEEAHKSASFALDMFESALSRMRTAYKKAEYEGNSSA